LMILNMGELSTSSLVVIMVIEPHYSVGITLFGNINKYSFLCIV